MRSSGTTALAVSYCLSSWSLWIDTGGTFADCVAHDPSGRCHTAKVLSTGTVRSRVLNWDGGREVRLASRWELPDDFFVGTDFTVSGVLQGSRKIVSFDAAKGLLQLDRPLDTVPDHATCEINPGVEAPILAAHWVTQTPFAGRLPRLNMRLATTRGTNALLERKGAAVTLFVTRGFADLLTIRSQQRPDLFALDIVRPGPLAHQVVEVEGRLDARGKVIQELDLDGLRRQAEQALNGGGETAAIALLHSYVNPRQEAAVAEVLREVGYRHISCSADLAPRIKLLPRAETAVVNAYLADILTAYLQNIAGLIRNATVFVLSSSGSLIPSYDFEPKDSLLSGPAGGVLGAVRAGQRCGLKSIIAFDMGGTSTDVSRFDGKLEIDSETTVGDVKLMSPSLAIESVAAGGGSICDFVHGELRVGPESAGSSPGPASYGAGGPLTLTDANLLLGRLDADRFEIPVDSGLAQTAAEGVLLRVRAASRHRMNMEQMLEGFLRIANERMAEAIRGISVRQGYRPADYDLVTFGGAGGQHACAVAENLGIDGILVPKGAGLLSAHGLGTARLERFAERQVLKPLLEVLSSLDEVLEEVANEAVERVTATGHETSVVEIRERSVFLRLVGQESTLEVDFSETANLEEEFRQSYLETYGYYPSGESRVEVESLRVVACSQEKCNPADALHGSNGRNTLAARSRSDPLETDP
ncbi:MAG: hydantoinase/oxoprolinase family protein, partial [Thermoanaerobaculia bacterium]